MFKKNKYPILITTIISCLIIIASLFVMAFNGVNLGVSLGGGTQVEVVLSDGNKTDDYTSKIEAVLEKYDLKIDTTFIQDKFVAGEEAGDMTRKILVIQSAGEASEETINKIVSEVATSVGLDESKVFAGKVVSSVSTKNVLRLAIAFGIIAAVMFVFGWVRYNVFAGIAFVISLLHNIILYFAMVTLTRIQLTVTSLSILIILTLVMVVALISIYEKFRETSKQQDAQKVSASQRMINGELQVVKPYLIVIAAIVIFTVCLFFIPVSRVVFIALNILLTTLISAYTLLLIGPSTFVALVEIVEMNAKAVLSRNDTVNKSIKKKIKKNKVSKQ